MINVSNPFEDFIERKNELNLYEKILELRKFEIENFWKRTLFFWGTLAIVLTAYFKGDFADKYLSFISLIGFLYNIIFSFSVRGSKYWQEHWEEMAGIYEDNSNFKLLTEPPFKPQLNSILTYPYRFSVSKLTMLLSDITVLMWGMFWIKDIINLFRKSYLKFEFSYSSNFEFFTFGVIMFHVIIIFYFIIFFTRGNVYYKIDS